MHVVHAAVDELPIIRNLICTTLSLVFARMEFFRECDGVFCVWDTTSVSQSTLYLVVLYYDSQLGCALRFFLPYLK